MGNCSKYYIYTISAKTNVQGVFLNYSLDPIMVHFKKHSMVKKIIFDNNQIIKVPPCIGPNVLIFSEKK